MPLTQKNEKRGGEMALLACNTSINTSTDKPRFRPKSSQLPEVVGSKAVAEEALLESIVTWNLENPLVIAAGGNEGGPTGMTIFILTHINISFGPVDAK